MPGRPELLLQGDGVRRAGTQPAELSGPTVAAHFVGEKESNQPHAARDKTPEIRRAALEVGKRQPVMYSADGRQGKGNPFSPNEYQTLLPPGMHGSHSESK